MGEGELVNGGKTAVSAPVIQLIRILDKIADFT